VKLFETISAKQIQTPPSSRHIDVVTFLHCQKK